jgi:hypothetical protein
VGVRVRVTEGVLDTVTVGHALRLRVRVTLTLLVRQPELEKDDVGETEGQAVGARDGESVQDREGVLVRVATEGVFDAEKDALTESQEELEEALTLWEALSLGEPLGEGVVLGDTPAVCVLKS